MFCNVVLQTPATPMCLSKRLECRNWWLNWTLRNHVVHNFDRNVACLLLSSVRILLISRQNYFFHINSIERVKFAPWKR